MSSADPSSFRLCFKMFEHSLVSKTGKVSRDTNNKDICTPDRRSRFWGIGADRMGGKKFDALQVARMNVIFVGLVAPFPVCWETATDYYCHPLGTSLALRRSPWTLQSSQCTAMSFGFRQILEISSTTQLMCSDKCFAQEWALATQGFVVKVLQVSYVANI